jgi:hypothetical protein
MDNSPGPRNFPTPKPYPPVPPVSPIETPLGLNETPLPTQIIPANPSMQNETIFDDTNSSVPPATNSSSPPQPTDEAVSAPQSCAPAQTGLKVTVDGVALMKVAELKRRLTESGIAFDKSAKKADLAALLTRSLTDQPKDSGATSDSDYDSVDEECATNERALSTGQALASGGDSSWSDSSLSKPCKPSKRSIPCGEPRCSTRWIVVGKTAAIQCGSCQIYFHGGKCSGVPNGLVAAIHSTKANPSVRWYCSRCDTNVQAAAAVIKDCKDRMALIKLFLDNSREEVGSVRAMFEEAKLSAQKENASVQQEVARLRLQIKQVSEAVHNAKESRNVVILKGVPEKLVSVTEEKQFVGNILSTAAKSRIEPTHFFRLKGASRPRHLKVFTQTEADAMKVLAGGPAVDMRDGRKFTVERHKTKKATVENNTAVLQTTRDLKPSKQERCANGLAVLDAINLCRGFKTCYAGRDKEAGVNSPPASEESVVNAKDEHRDPQHRPVCSSRRKGKKPLAGPAVRMAKHKTRTKRPQNLKDVALSENEGSSNSLRNDLVTKPDDTHAPKGIENPRNACYASSVLQMMMQCVRKVPTEKQSEALRRISQVYGSEQPDVTAFVDQAGLKIDGESKFSVNEQSCAIEFLEEYIQQTGLNITDSVVTTTFTCSNEKGCGSNTDSVQSAPVLKMMFDAKGNDQSIWPPANKHETTSFCAKCQRPMTGTERISRVEGAEFVVVAVSRNENCGGAMTKNCKSVNLPEQIVDDAGKSYELLGTVDHIGVDVRTGHYTARIMYEGSWLSINDTNLSREHLSNSTGDVVLALFGLKQQ